MGILRFLMALAVVATHADGLPPFHFIPGMKAVQTFYIISGFYMALILEDKYLEQPHSYKLFITNRILRIYPIYFIILLLSLFYYSSIHVLKGPDNPLVLWENFLKQDNWLMLGSILFTTVFILGQDILLLVAGLPIGHAFLVPQAWTLSLELMFYLLAPFLVRRRTAPLAAIFFASVCLAIFLYMLGLKFDPWTHRFFPSALALFIAGILSFRIYQLIRHKDIPFFWNATAFATVLAMIFLFPILGPSLSYGKTISYFLALSLGLPFIFYLTKNNKFDRWIGDFSYPIYISHLLVQKIFFDCGITTSNPWLGWGVAAGSFLFSFALLYLIIYPIDKIREKRVLDHKL